MDNSGSSTSSYARKAESSASTVRDFVKELLLVEEKFSIPEPAMEGILTLYNCILPKGNNCPVDMKSFR